MVEVKEMTSGACSAVGAGHRDSGTVGVALFLLGRQCTCAQTSHFTAECTVLPPAAWGQGICSPALYGKRRLCPLWSGQRALGPSLLLVLQGGDFGRRLTLASLGSAAKYRGSVPVPPAYCGVQLGLLVLFLHTCQLTELSQNPDDSISQ